VRVVDLQDECFLVRSRLRSGVREWKWELMVCWICSLGKASTLLVAGVEEKVVMSDSVDVVLGAPLISFLDLDCFLGC
jgi:hypothetical protein